MPIYQYSCLACDLQFEMLLKLSEMEEPLEQPCPECEAENSITQDATAANFGDPIRLGIKRPDAGWGEVLSKVKEAQPKGNWANKKFNPRGGR